MVDSGIQQNGLIAVPAKNCGPFIAGAVEDLLANIDTEKWLIAVFINSSSDNTLAEAKRMEQAHPGKVIVFDNKKDYGLGGSFQLAFEFARKCRMKHMGLFHGDHQAEARDLAALLEDVENKQAAGIDVAAVLGSRFSFSSRRTGYSLKRLLGNYLLNALASAITWHWIPELGSGCNVYRVKDFDKQLIQSLPKDVTFDLDLLLLMIQRRIPFHFHPISWNDFGQTSTVRDFQVGWTILRTLLRWRFKIAI